MNFRAGDKLIFRVFYTDTSSPAVAFDANQATVDVIQMQDDGTEVKVVSAQAATKSAEQTGLQYYIYTAPTSGNASAFTAIFNTTSSEVAAADLPSGVFALFPAEQNMDVAVSTRAPDGKVVVKTTDEAPSHITIRVGDDYTSAFNRAFQWLFRNRPELVGGVANLAIDGIRIADGTVVDSGTDAQGNTLQTVIIEVDTAESLLLVDSVGVRQEMTVQITDSGELMVEVSGTATVKEQHPQP